MQKTAVATLRRIACGLCMGAMALCNGAASAAPPEKLYLFNWSQYMDPAIIKQFEAEYHVTVVRNFFQSNGELFAKLRAGGDSQYDVVVPSNYFVPRLVKAGLLQPLDKSRIPNLRNLRPKFLNPSYDPHNQYTAAYQWGDTGIVYNTDQLPNAPESWAIIYDPAFNKRYPFSIDHDAQGAFGTACAYLGEGFDCDSRASWKKAARLLLETKKRPNFSGFIQGAPTLKRIARGSVDAGLTYNGNYVSDKKSDPKTFAHTRFVIPKEGAELWVDNMAIPAHAPHPKLANEFINFILRAKIGAELSNYNHFGSPNAASKPMLDPDLQKPPMMPTPAEMKRLHFKPILGGDRLQFVEQLWNEVQSE